MSRLFSHWEKHAPPGSTGPHLFAVFSEKAGIASAEILRVQTWTDAGEALLDIARKANVSKVVVCPGSLVSAADIPDRLRGGGTSVYTDPGDIAEHAETSDMGVSEAALGVAETGSVCHDATSISSRLVSILTPLHVMLLPSGNIVKTIEDAFAIIASTFDRGYIGWTTGPSRTADIERVLTIGVHGPSRFVVIAVDEPQPEETT